MPAEKFPAASEFTVQLQSLLRSYDKRFSLIYKRPEHPEPARKIRITEIEELLETVHGELWQILFPEVKVQQVSRPEAARLFAE